MYISDLKHSVSSLEDKLYELHNLSSDKNMVLDFRPPFLDLLEAFENPQDKLPPVIHIAGTNGKGSIIAIMKAILEAAGYRVHAYTSPHLKEFNERIYLAGKNIEDAALEKLIDQALTLNQGREITFFEITTAMAFAAFSRAHGDIVLLETGLGGRLDCTNVIKAPLATIISTISYDHMDILGDTLVEIAAEKAGIMKQSVPCILGPQIDSEVIDVFARKAEDLDLKLYHHGSDWFIEPKGEFMEFTFDGTAYEMPKPALKGVHQIQNAGTALTALKIIQEQFKISDENIAAGLKNIIWPARLQNIGNEFKYIIPPDWEIWLDGGHNQNAAEALASQAIDWKNQDIKELHLIMGMMSHKDPITYIKPLYPHIKSLCLIEIPGEPQAINADELAPILKSNFKNLNIFRGNSVNNAIDLITNRYKQSARILIGGSLYLAGHVLENLSQ